MHRSGREVHVSLTASPLRDEVGVVVVARDNEDVGGEFENKKNDDSCLASGCPDEQVFVTGELSLKPT